MSIQEKIATLINEQKDRITAHGLASRIMQLVNQEEKLIAPEWIKCGDEDSVFNQTEQRFYVARIDPRILQQILSDMYIDPKILSQTGDKASTLAAKPSGSPSEPGETPITGKTGSAANARQVAGAHYSHYSRELQHWDMAAAHNWDYFQGQITKYVDRWKEKNGLEDLLKAQHYLEKYIEVERAKLDLNPGSPTYVGHIKARQAGAPCICIKGLDPNMNCPWHGR